MTSIHDLHNPRISPSTLSNPVKHDTKLVAFQRKCKPLITTCLSIYLTTHLLNKESFQIPTASFGIPSINSDSWQRFNLELIDAFLQFFNQLTPYLIEYSLTWRVCTFEKIWSIFIFSGVLVQLLIFCGFKPYM